MSAAPKSRKVLADLVTAIETGVARIDAEMRGPSTFERGRRIAQLLNALETAKNRARFSADGLDIDFRTNKRRDTR